jgi:hypothetical protein
VMRGDENGSRVVVWRREVVYEETIGRAHALSFVLLIGRQVLR